MYLTPKVYQETLTNMRQKILVTRKISDLAEEKLKKEFDVQLNATDTPIKDDDLTKLANNFDGIVSTGWDNLGVNFFEKIESKLKIISQVGVGYDNISILSAQKKKN